MFEAVWQFLSDPANQAPIKMVAGGISTVVVGLFAVYRLHYKPKSEEKDKNKIEKSEKPLIQAINKSVAGETISNNTINIR